MFLEDLKEYQFVDYQLLYIVFPRDLLLYHS